MDPRIDSLSDGEREWITAHLRVARSFVATYGGGDSIGPVPTLEALDAAWSAWLPQWEQLDPNAVINAVGAAIGEHLIAMLGLRWVVATDEHGAELAVYGEPCTVLVYPPNLVAKRFESRTSSFIARLVRQMVEDVRKMRAEQAT
jgi:hypothetical protein